MQLDFPSFQKKQFANLNFVLFSSVFHYIYSNLPDTLQNFL